MVNMFFLYSYFLGQNESGFDVMDFWNELFRTGISFIKPNVTAIGEQYKHWTRAFETCEIFQWVVLWDINPLRVCRIMGQIMTSLGGASDGNFVNTTISKTSVWIDLIHIHNSEENYNEKTYTEREWLV